MALRFLNDGVFSGDVAGTILTSQKASIPPSNGSFIGRLNFKAYRVGTTYSTGASITAVASSAWTGTSTGTHLQFSTTSDAQVNPVNKMYLTSGGDLGVGVQFPGSRISVSGFTGAYSSGIGFEPVGTGARIYRTFINTDGSFNLDDATAGETRLKIDSAGNVGIGTTSNSAGDTNNGVPKLQVGTTTAILGEFPLAARFTTGFDAGNNSGVSVLINSGNDRGLMISAGRQSGNVAKASLNIVGSDGVEIETLTLLQKNSGGTTTNVGIGTASPETKLHIADSTSPIFTLERLDTITTANEVIGQFNFKSTDSSDTGVNASIKVIKQDLPVATVPMAITFETGVSGTVDERMRITSVGEVGIGTASPSQLLHVSSTTSNPTGIGLQNSQRYYSVRSNNFSLVFTDETVGSERMRIDSAGNVGIGTTSPASKLEVIGTATINASVNSIGTMQSSTALNSTVLQLSSNYEDNMGQPAWTVSSGSYTNNSVTAPDGTTTGTSMTFTTTSYDLYYQITGLGAADEGKTFKMTVWLKLGTATNFVMTPNNGAWNTLDSRSFDADDGLNTTTWVQVTHEFIYTAAGRTYINFHVGANTGGAAQTAGTVFAWDWQFLQVSANDIYTPNIKLDGITGNYSYLNGGDVGIGTATPNTLLHVKGGADDNESLLYVENTHFAGGTQYPAAMFTNTYGNHSFGTIAEFRTGNTDGTDRPSILFTNGVTTNNWSVGQGVYSGNDNFAIGFRAAHPGVVSAWADPKIVILTGGNVGIGTTGPSFKLEVDTNGVHDGIKIRGANAPGLTLQDDSSSSTSSILIQSTASAQGNLRISADENNVATGATIEFKVSGSDKMRILANGKVGIGTISPAFKLQVGDNGFGDGNIAMKANGTGADAGAELTFNMTVAGGNANSHIAQIVSTAFDSSASNNNSLNFKVGGWNNNQDAGVSKMTILSNGNVGIGADNPAVKLDVRGTNSGVLDITHSYGYAASGNYAIKLHGLDISVAQPQKGYLSQVANDGGLMLASGMRYWGSSKYEPDTASASMIRMPADGTVSIWNNTGLTAGTEYYPTERLKILTNGNVGIGENSPDAKLHIKQTSDGSNTLIITEDNARKLFIGRDEIKCTDLNNAGTILYMQHNGSATSFGGNVTLGATQSRSVVYDAGGGNFRITPNSGGYSTGYFFNQSDGTFRGGYGTFGGTNTLSYFWIGDNYNDASMVIYPTDGSSSAGFVGIGDPTPGYKLDVNGTIRATGDVIAFSDARVKDNVVTIDNALDKVNRLRGVTYTRNDIEDKQTKMGVIAQEVLEVIPEVVQQDDKGNYSVAYGNMNGLLIEAIKELKAEIEELKSRL